MSLWFFFGFAAVNLCFFLNIQYNFKRFLHILFYTFTVSIQVCMYVCLYVFMGYQERCVHACKMLLPLKYHAKDTRITPYSVTHITVTKLTWLVSLL